MKTEELKALGLDQAQIDAVMKQNGADVEAEKAKTVAAEADRDQHKEKLETAEASLETFKDVDPAELNKTIADLKDELKTKDDTYAAEKAEREFNAKLEGVITELGGKNPKAITALIDRDALMQSKNQDADIKTAFESLKEKEAYLFGSTEPINNPVAPTGGGTPGAVDANTASLRTAMGLGVEKKD